jgi:hypothetical protein
MSLKKLSQMANAIIQTMDEEKLPLAYLSGKMEKALEVFPNDQTLINMAKVVDKLESKQMFIRQAEFKKLYNQFYTNQNKFAEVFQSELGIKDEVEPEAMPAEYKPLDSSAYTDPVLYNALSSMFNGEEVKEYSKTAALKAIDKVKSTLDMWSLPASKLVVEAGNDKFLVVKAEYDTPKGKTSIMIPVQLIRDKIASAEVFIGNSGAEDLNNHNLKQYITKNTGIGSKIAASVVLSALTTQPANKLSTVELAAFKVRANRTHDESLFANAILGQTEFEVKQDVVVPELAETETFAEKLSSPEGDAAMYVGAKKVNLGRTIIASMLAQIGFKASSIKVAKANKESVTYLVKAADKAFSVPVKIKGDKVIKPSILIANGSVKAFNRDGVASIKNDNVLAAKLSSQGELTPGALIESIYEAVSEHNLAKAQDALNVLAVKGTPEQYKKAFDVLLTEMTAEPKETCKCALAHKSPNSSELICGHTNLPMSKVYQDESGDCLPLRRRGMKIDNAGAFYMTQKILG